MKAIEAGFLSPAGGTSASIAGNQDEIVACGGYVAPGVWKEFDCYNLAAIGKTTGDDPFSLPWWLLGGYWQKDRKKPDPSMGHTINTPNFAHGPTDPSARQANEGEIIDWDKKDAPMVPGPTAIRRPMILVPRDSRVSAEILWRSVFFSRTHRVLLERGQTVPPTPAVPGFLEIT